MAESPNPTGSSLVTVKVTSEGTEIDQSVQLVSVTVHKAVNRIPVATLVVDDGDMPNQDFPVSASTTFKPGAAITIAAGYEGAEETIFEGIVVKHGISIRDANVSQLVVECRDKAVAMTLARTSAYFLQVADSDVITTLIGNHGLSADVEATAHEHEELVQYYCTDWDYMLARAEVNGMLVVVDAGTVSVKKPDASAQPDLVVTWGEDLIRLEAEMDARWQRSSVSGEAWDPATQALLSKESSPTTLFGQGDLSAATLATALASDTADVLQSPAPLADDVLQAWTDARQAKSELARIRGRMTFEGTAKAVVGTPIEVAGVGSRFTGNAFVGSVRHEIARGGWTTEVELGLDPFWFTERKDVMAPPASGVAPGISGLHIGTVLKLDEDPDGARRVQVDVQAPGLSGGDGVWARLSTFYASNTFGAFFIPEVGDEVVLGFLNDDPSFPVILGSVYSKTQLPPPYELTAENDIKAIVTRSQLKIEFDDDKKVVTILTPAGNTLVLSDDDQSILVEDETGNKVELSPDGILLSSPKDITVTADGKISMTAKETISLEATQDLTATGMNVTHEAKTAFTAKGSASAELSASGQTTVKGAMVMIN